MTQSIYSGDVKLHYSKDGRQTPITALTTAHLINIVKLKVGQVTALPYLEELTRRTAAQDAEEKQKQLLEEAKAREFKYALTVYFTASENLENLKPSIELDAVVNVAMKLAKREILVKKYAATLSPR